MQKEPQKISDSEEKAEFYQKETKDVEIPSMLLVYMPLRNPGAKLVRELKEGKISTYMPLLP